MLPFAVHGNQRFDFLAQGLVDLLSRNLDGAGDLRSVDGATVLAAARGQSGVADVEVGRRLARNVGAGLYVLGNVSAIGGQVRIGHPHEAPAAPGVPGGESATSRP